MSIARHHAEWLSLLEISGPFLSLNALMRVFPQGLEMLEPARAAELRAAYDEWSTEVRDPRFHRAWVLYVLKSLLEWDESVIAEGQAIPEPLQYTAVEHGGETVRPDFILHERRQPNQVRSLVSVYPPGLDIEKPIAKTHWSASPAARMLSLLYATGVRLGIVTNGEQWMLVNASKSGTAGYISWYAELWNEERLTLRAFTTLLGARRFFGVVDEDTLEAMLDESVNDAQEVTDQLGAQVRHAVEILVRALDRVDQDSGGVLLADVGEAKLYEATLTVMMRLVFLLSAEERGLFLLGDPLYDQNYAISTLRAQLHEDADRTGEEVLERRSDAWSRLLATFRLVYFGSTHEDMKLPAYGGSLFDPDRFSFLEGRIADMDGIPPAVDNRTVLHLLDALQILQTRGEARRLSFRALDIEQIGHVYEGLLDHEARRADDVVLGFSGSLEAEIALSELEAQSDLHKFLKEATGRSSVSPIRNALNRPLDGERLRRLHVACLGDDALFQRVMPFLNLLRDDEFGYPIVIMPGSVYVTAGTERRSTGTHYTPRSLTEPIVEHTLEPLVYHGVAEGLPAEEWELKSPGELLALKVCDMAMGSGAFLVQACRYLAARLIEAWDIRLAAEDTPIPRLTVEGESPTGGLAEILIPDNPDERQTLALRLVADRCLYGVDKNPLAVEMSKLSLWLTTLAKGRPFTFLDHAMKCGDSLVGVSLEQLRNWNLEISDKPQAVPLLVTRIRTQIEGVVELRRRIESFTVNTVSDQQEKQRLLNEAEAKTHDLRVAADLLLASVFNSYSKSEQAAMRGHLLEVVEKGSDVPEGYFAPVETVFNLAPFHWELEFPEVFAHAFSSGFSSDFQTRATVGFDAFIGNPPFQGGKHITGLFGTPYRNYLVNYVADGQKGNADLCTYFFLGAYARLRPQGTFGLIATNSIAQGDTRDVGLVQLDNMGANIYRAVNDLVWPGAAAVVVDVVHIHKGAYKGEHCLESQPVEFITPLLDDVAVSGRYLPETLNTNLGKSFIGSIVMGIGFVVPLDEAATLIDQSQRNRDVLFPYLNGEDLNEMPDQSPRRWVINFFDWDLERAEQYGDCMAIVRERVKPDRDELATGGASARDYARRWWQYGRMGVNLYRTINGLQRVLVIARTSKTAAFSFMSKDMVFSEAVVVVASESGGIFAVIQSALHISWAWRHSSSLKEDLRYSPTDCLENYPFPYAEALVSLEGIGEKYHETRRQIMLDQQEGLTATYNRFHDPNERSDDIQHLRDLHRQMDEAVAWAYGWDDLDLGHDFHDTAQGVRYTISETARREVLKRLLALNFERYEEEQRLGIGIGAKKSRGRRNNRAEDDSLADDNGEDEDDTDPNALPPEQESLWDDDTPKQKRLF